MSFAQSGGAVSHTYNPGWHQPNLSYKNNNPSVVSSLPSSASAQAYRLALPQSIQSHVSPAPQNISTSPQDDIASIKKMLFRLGSQMGDCMIFHPLQLQLLLFPAIS